MKKKKLTINTANIKQENKISNYITSNGTFKDDSIEINKDGLLIHNQNLNSKEIVKDKKDLNSFILYDKKISLELKDLEMISIIGKGSSGIVKKAYHQPTGIILAVKIIPLDIQENIRKRIISELKTLHKSRNEYIVSFFDAFYDEGSIFIALEYMDAGSLTDLLKKCKSIPENILKQITIQILKGLHYLHKQLHLIHRDIKPSNLLINKAGKVKISDFGVSGQLAHTLSQCLSYVGTYAYMSPERISGLSYSYNSDIWSLGILLMECILGKYPYLPPDKKETQELSFWELVDKIVKGPSPILPKNNNFSIEFQNFIELCIQKIPEKRPSSFDLLCHSWLQKLSSSNEENFEYWLKQWIL